MLSMRQVYRDRAAHVIIRLFHTADTIDGLGLVFLD